VRCTQGIATRSAALNSHTAKLRGNGDCALPAPARNGFISAVRSMRTCDGMVKQSSVRRNRVDVSSCRPGGAATFPIIQLREDRMVQGGDRWPIRICSNSPGLWRERLPTNQQAPSALDLEEDELGYTWLDAQGNSGYNSVLHQ